MRRPSGGSGMRAPNPAVAMRRTLELENKVARQGAILAMHGLTTERPITPGLFATFSSLIYELTAQERAAAWTLYFVAPAEVPKSRLSRSAWGPNGCGRVNVLIHRLRAKLGADAITTIRGSGYFMPAAVRDRLTAEIRGFQ